MTLAKNVERRIDRTDDCWLWTGYVDKRGYARVTVNGRRWMAHRYTYTYLVGPIPDGLDLDHLCRRPSCVNPLHLEPVTRAENLSRSPIAPATINASKTHCRRGHEFDDANTWTRPNGWRDCRACSAIRNQERAYRWAQSENGNPPVLPAVTIGNTVRFRRSDVDAKLASGIPVEPEPDAKAAI